MKLSIIIVNYNVEHFLEQCLLSVQKASKGIEVEVFVVDNNSIDGSINMIKEKFPEVIMIVNNENVGFSKANNQAIRLAKENWFFYSIPTQLLKKTPSKNAFNSWRIMKMQVD